MELTLVASSAVFKIFIMMSVGFIGARTGIMDEKATSVMTAVTVNLLNPLMVFNGFMLEYNEEKKYGLLITLLFTLIIQFVGIAVGRILTKKKSPTRNVELASIQFANCGFLGIPLALTIFGQESVFYMSIYSSTLGFYVWTYGAILLSGKSSFKDVLKALKNPAIPAAVLGMIVYFTQIKIPELILSPIASVGSCTSPIALMIAGSMIARADIKSALKKTETYIVCFGRLLAVPLVVMLILKFIPAPDMAKTAALIASACPISTVIQMAAGMYGADTERSALYFGVSNVACLITIPIVLSIWGLIA